MIMRFAFILQGTKSHWKIFFFFSRKGHKQKCIQERFFKIMCNKKWEKLETGWLIRRQLAGKK